MTANLDKASADARHFLSQFRSLTTFAQSIADLGEVEGRTKGLKDAEAQAAKDLEAAKIALGSAQGQLKGLMTEIEKQKSIGASIVEDAKVRASDITTRAVAEAKGVQEESAAAKSRADQEMAVAKSQFNKEYSAAQDALAAKQKELEEAQAAVEEVKKRFA